jgi:hypothetical protein
MASYNYDLCGTINFKSRANLKNHLKGMYCKVVCERKARPSTSKGHVEGEDVHISQDAKDVHISKDALQSLSFLEQPISDNDLVPHLDDAKPFDCTFVLLHWIKSCRNGMGLS